MQTFTYKGFDAGGRTQKGLIEAIDLKQAREKLAAQGILPELLASSDGQQAHRRWFAAHGFNREMRTMFYQELTALLRAGFPLVSTLDILIQTPDTESVRPTLANVRNYIKEGHTLADSLAKACPTLSDYEKAVISAGEKAAALDLVLERLAAFMEEQNQLKERIITALVYPAIVFVMALIIAIGLLGFALPHMGKMLMEQSHVTLPLLTRGMIALGHLFMTWGPLALLSLAIGTMLFWNRLRRDDEKRRQLNRQLFQLPVFGKGYTLLVNIRFARTLSLLLRGGVPMIESLQLAGESTGNAWVKALVYQEAESVRHGASLGDALRRIPPLGAALASWIRIGETGSSLENLLDSAARRFQQQWDRFLSRRLMLLEPILIIFIGAFVLLVVLAIILPVVALNRSIM